MTDSGGGALHHTRQADNAEAVLDPDASSGRPENAAADEVDRRAGKDTPHETPGTSPPGRGVVDDGMHEDEVPEPNEPA
jgi:hypothetical protein